MNNVPPGLSLVAENDHLVLKRDCVLEVQYHLDEQAYLSKFETMGLPYQHDLLKQSVRKVMGKDPILRPEVVEEKKPIYSIPHPPKFAHSNSGEKPYQCDTCKKTFSQQSNLCKHVLIHYGVKPFGCDTCGKRFTQQANLIKHKRIHTGDKPFTCKVCLRQFSQNANLKKHTQLHTGEKRYRCEFCDKAFVQQANLERHRRTHTGEKPFSCEVCQKKFTQKGNLVKHEVIHYLKDSSRLASQFQPKMPGKDGVHNLLHVADLPSQSTSHDSYHKKMAAPVIVSARDGMFVKRF